MNKGRKQLKYWIGLIEAVFLSLACVTNAPADDAGRADDVAAELGRFAAAWSEPVPVDDARYGIVRVLSLLNLNYPGLVKVKAAAEAGQYELAQEELLHYFKATRTDRPTEPDVSIRGKNHRWIADNALRHLFQGNGDAHPPVYRGTRIDWVGKAVVDGQVINDVEWYHQFHRLFWWPALAWTYTDTADERYFLEWRYEMVRWATHNLPISQDTPDFIPTGMNTYFRCQQLTRVLPHMIRSQNFDSRTLLYFLVFFHEQAEYIRTVYSSSGNHLLGELSTVFLNGVKFPEFKLAPQWIDEAAARLPQMMFDEVYGDGMNKELVFSYHVMYTSLFAQAYTLFRENGYADRLPAEFYRRLLKMMDIYAMQCFPDFTVTQFGDAWKYRDPSAAFRNEMAPYVKDLPYAEFFLSRGKQGNPPDRCNAAYPESGFYFFRSDWTPDAVFMAAKCSPPGAWHNQFDNGTFELYACGRNLMTDTGSYMYGSYLEDDRRWREWFRSTRVHQTLTLDNQNAERQPRHILWLEKDNLVAAVFENASYPGLTHRRSILFIDNRWFLIYDEVIGDAAGDVGIHFQFAPGECELDGLSARTGYPQGANLLVKTFPQGKDVELEKEEGWISYKPQVKEPRPAWCWKVTRDKSDPQITLLTALIPYRQGQAPKTVEATVTDAEDARIFELQVDQTVRHLELDMSATNE